MFQRRKKWYLHVPTASGGHVQKTTGTTDKKLANRMRAMVAELRDKRDWPALSLVSNNLVSLGALYDAYAHHALAAFVGREASPKWETLVDGWLRSLDVVPSTRTMYAMQVRAVLPEGARVMEITTGVLRDGLAALAVSSATRRNYLAALQSFCGYLVAHDLLATSPAADTIRLPRPKKGKPRTMWMTGAEDARLCWAAPSPFREYFALVHGTGAERSAALMMTRADIDLDRWECHIPGTKTATRDRSGIPIDVWARPILGPYVRAVLSGPLFPTLSRDAVNRAHVDARTAAGLPDYQLRDARHSVAIRWLVADNVPMWDVAERLGHADMAMATKVYTKTVLREAAKRLSVDLTVERQGVSK